MKNGVSAKESLRHRHDQRRADALPRDVADAEVEALVVPEKVVEVAADLFGGPDERVDRKGRIFRKLDRAARKHAHLDFARQTERLFVALFVEVQLGQSRAFDGHRDMSRERAHERFVMRIKARLPDLVAAFDDAEDVAA